MNNLNIKINLEKLNGAFLTNVQKGEEKTVCLVIPIEQAHLYLGKKGCYLSMNAIELAENKFGESHYVKQHFDSDIYKAMSEEEKKQIQILGSCKKLEFNNRIIEDTFTVNE